MNDVKLFENPINPQALLKLDNEAVKLLTAPETPQWLQLSQKEIDFINFIHDPQYEKAKDLRDLAKMGAPDWIVGDEELMSAYQDYREYSSDKFARNDMASQLVLNDMLMAKAIYYNLCHENEVNPNEENPELRLQARNILRQKKLSPLRERKQSQTAASTA